MLKIKIINKIYYLPSKLSELKFKIKLECDKILEDFNSDFDNPDMNKMLLATLLQVDYLIVEPILNIDVKTIIINLIYFKNKINFKFNGIIKFKNKLYKLQTFDNMTVDNYSDIEFYLKEENYNKLFNYLIKKINLFNIKYIFLYLFIKNYNNVDDMNYYVYYYFLSSYLIWNKNMLDNYGMLDNDKEVYGIDQIDPEEMEATKKKNPLDTWGMYNMIMNVCQLDYSEFNRWRSRTIEEFFKYAKYISLKMIEMKNEKGD